MATKGERQALLFLAAVALLGAGTRVYRARTVAVESAGLEQQLAAVDSAAERPTPRRSGRSRAKRPSPDSPTSQPTGPIDLDTAPAEEIERLPGIGPALARRIVSDRDSNGPFGCLAALDGVKGIGPALLKGLDSAATFSGAARPVCLRSGVVPASSGRAAAGLPRR